MTADANPIPTTAVLRQSLGDLLGHWTARARARRSTVAQLDTRTPRRRRLRAAPPVPMPDLWTIDRDELRSALDGSGF
jgi:hypothetical protein